MGHHAMRRQFVCAFWRDTRIVWPILSALVVWQVALGAIVGMLEQWPWDTALYFTFITSLTVGYGDFVPKTDIGRLLVVLIGFAGILLTGLITAVGVRALQSAAVTEVSLGR